MRPVPIIGDFALIPVTWWTLVLLVAGALTALLVVSRRRLNRDDAEPAARRAWWRRLAIVVVTVLAMAGPAIRGSEAISVSNVEIYMVVDRTGSMAAEDYQGKGPDGVDQAASTRLDGVRSDMRAVRDAFPDSRFSIIALDNTAATELPLTHDTNAVDSWIGSLKQEVTNHATGSSLEVALPLLGQSLVQSQQSDPKDIRLVYIFSDGEATDDGRGAQAADSAGISWQSLAGLVDGGAVLGYGTAEGGQMRSYDGSAATGEHTQSDYIADGEGGQPGVSKIDENELQTVAKDMGLPYYHRTGGSGDDPTSAFTNLDIEAVTSDGRTKTNARVYLTWPLGIIAFGLLLWEIIDLMRADRRLRLLMGRGR
ncbi:VWA domain-containing protein [Actinomyces viscosus]|uniref:vWA domain-containing protein n=1 Tax=Actinomyces viscosus TaxID=1656 RepID=UPI0028E9A3F8|nr:VWA domain-containing protein [Actinomyces viscosus]